MTDRFEEMRAFIAVCDTQGFSAAARKLDLSPSVVTRLVAGLEERLGVRLLQRTTRSVSLTDAGSRYLERARRIVAELDEAELSAQEERGEPTGRLVIAAPSLFGRLHVRPLASRYLQLYPKATIELQLANHFVHLVEDGVDLAVRVGELVDSGLIARLLGQARRVLVASPFYLAAHGTPRAPDQLAAHRLIVIQTAAARREWPFWVGGAEIAVPVTPHFCSNSGDAAIEHAVEGGGIVAAFNFQTVEARRTGQLVEVLRDFAPPPVPIQALFPTSRLLSRKVRAFIELLQQSASAWRLDESAVELGDQPGHEGAG